MSELTVYFKDQTTLVIPKVQSYNVIDRMLDIKVPLGTGAIDRYTIDWDSVKYVLEATRN